MFKSPGRNIGIKKSPITFIKAVTSPRTQPRNLPIRNDKMTTTVSNQVSMHSYTKPQNLLILTLQLQTEKPTRSLKLFFTFDSETSIQQLLSFLKKQVNEEYVFFKSQSLNIDYFLTLPHRKIAELEIKKLHLIVEKIKIDRNGAVLNNFKIIRCIGTGGFSKVYLVQGYGKLMALKVINKAFIMQNDKQNIVVSQRDILDQCNGHPFITQLYMSFETPNYLIFCMEYCNGGELFNLLRKVRRMKENQAEFYFLQTLAAIAHLHAHNILYRDLKPQNIIIDADGHIRLADYGLSKIMREDRTHSFCGSAQYMAPQMLLKKGHGFEIDYYCLGALLYELLFGLPPYYSRDQDELFNNILTQDLQFPSNIHISKELKSFLEKLLQKDINLRYSKISQILKDPWLVDCSMEEVLQKKLKPPFQTSMFQNNIDDSDFASEEQTYMLQLEKEKLLQKLKPENVAFPDFGFVSKQMEEIENHVKSSENKKWNFTKKAPQPVQEHQFTKQLLWRTGSVKSVGSSNRRIMELIHHSPRAMQQGPINFTEQIKLVQRNQQYPSVHLRSSQVINIPKAQQKVISSSYKLMEARSMPTMEKYQHMLARANERGGSPINVNNYIHIQTSKSPQINFNANSFTYARPQAQPRKMFSSNGPSFQKNIHNSSYKNLNNNNVRTTHSGMGSLDRVKFSSCDRQFPINNNNYIKNNVYYQSTNANQIARAYLSNFKQRINPNLKMKKSIKSSDKLNFNFISTSPPPKH